MEKINSYQKKRYVDYRAGYKVTVIDMTEQGWWKGKCLGRVGYFPSKYVTRLQSGERVLQATRNLQVSAADSSDKGLTLLRDQVRTYSVSGGTKNSPKRSSFQTLNPLKISLHATIMKEEKKKV